MSTKNSLKKEVELCGEFIHGDDDGLIICLEISGTEHSHHDGEECLKCRKATPEEEAACRALWEKDEDACVHLKDNKVIDIREQ